MSATQSWSLNDPNRPFATMDTKTTTKVNERHHDQSALLELLREALPIIESLVLDGEPYFFLQEQIRNTLSESTQEGAR